MGFLESENWFKITLRVNEVRCEDNLLECAQRCRHLAPDQASPPGAGQMWKSFQQNCFVLF